MSTFWFFQLFASGQAAIAFGFSAFCLFFPALLTFVFPALYAEMAVDFTSDFTTCYMGS